VIIPKAGPDDRETPDAGREGIYIRRTLVPFDLQRRNSAWWHTWGGVYMLHRPATSPAQKGMASARIVGWPRTTTWGVYNTWGRGMYEGL